MAARRCTATACWPTLDAARQGGHLVPEETVIGRDGLVAHAVSGAEAGFRITGDATGFDLLSPAAWT